MILNPWPPKPSPVWILLSLPISQLSSLLCPPARSPWPSLCLQCSALSQASQSLVLPTDHSFLPQPYLAPSPSLSHPPGSSLNGTCSEGVFWALDQIFLLNTTAAPPGMSFVLLTVPVGIYLVSMSSFGACVLICMMECVPCEVVMMTEGNNASEGHGA